MRRRPAPPRPNPTRDQLHFDPSFILEGARPSRSYIDHPTCDGNAVYPGQRVRWCGHRGAMLRVRSAFVLPTVENIFYPSHLAGLVAMIEESDTPVVFDAPPARVHTVSAHQLQEQREADARGRDSLARLLGEEYMTRPWARHEVGKRYVRLVDGNHRAFAAILAGEPSVWVYVLEDYRDAVRDLLR